jgi:hypothetical protein
MLPGISGALVAGAFLEEVLLPELDRDSSDTTPAFPSLQRWWRRVERELGPASSARTVLDVAVLPLLGLLQYRVLHLEPHQDGFVGMLGVGSVPIAVLRTTGWDGDRDLAWRDVVRTGRTARVPWGLVCTGSACRIVDASRAWSRRALDFELAPSLADRRSAVTFRALAKSAALSPAGSPSLARIVERADAHGVRVCATLGEGVLDALTAIVGALDQHPAAATRNRPSPLDAPPDAAFEQALTVVYRLLFLLFAEARALVPTWHDVYREAYTIEGLCRRIIERRRGVWAALQAIARLAHAGCRAGDLVVTPFNSRLFSPSATPLGERARVADAAVGRAVMSLATTPAADGRRRIAYGDLGVEQLGSIYERVLEYEPSRRGGLVVLTRTSTERKSTGSFYTPRAMTEFLVRRALHPLVTGRSSEDILKLRIVDPAMGSGAFLVAACRYLAIALERALVHEGASRDTDDRRHHRAALRRLIAQRCLYGVDLNPMAVQLARLSLWLTTLARDRPLTFLDHHLAVGDSLLGAGLSQLARPPSWRRPPVTHRRELPLFANDDAEGLLTTVLPDRFRLALGPEDTPADVQEKERALAKLVAPGAQLARWKAAADAWCADWFLASGPLSPTVFADFVRSTIGQGAALHPHQHAALAEGSTRIARAQRFFHWELEFPEVFFDGAGRRNPAGGFDAVIGNPPWDVLRADSGDDDSRQRARPDRAARLRFFRTSGLYRHQGTGHANRYRLFIERALHVVRPGGRIALVLPSGLATDHGSGPIRRALLDHVHVDRLIGFDNRAGIFPIHRDVRFLLFTGTAGGQTERLTCAFGWSAAECLDRLPDATADDPPDVRPIVLSRALLDSWDREHLSWPMLTSPVDLEVLVHLLESVPRLGDRDGWHASFGRELNATQDAKHFVVSRPRSPALCPVVDGKHLDSFRFSDLRPARAIPRKTAARLLDPQSTF